MNCLYHFFLLVFFFPLLGIAQSNTIHGVVVDQDNKQSIPYASIGIKESPYGTVADSAGNFTLIADSKLNDQTDSVIFSAVGYQRLSMSLGSLSHSNNQVILFPATNLLSTIKINIKSPSIKTYGKSSAMLIFAPRLYKAIPKESDEKGREQATILKVDKDIILYELSLRTGSFKNVEKMKVRMNVYDVEDGIPNALIIRNDIIFDIYPDTLRKVEMPAPRIIDLRDYNIRLQGYTEIAVGIEVLNIDYIHEDSVKTVFIVPSSPNPLKSSFYRLKSQAPWEKLKASNLMLKLEAILIKERDVQTEGKSSIL